MALGRIQREWNDMLKNPPTSFTFHNVDECMLHWKVTIFGPEDSPYAGGAFDVDVDIPVDYPYSHPKIIFETKIFHPNINKHNGTIYPDIVEEMWTAARRISDIVESIRALLTEPRLDDPLEQEIADMYKNNRAEYDTVARQWTDRHAKRSEAAGS
ncbi:hypothetical protein IEQ34_005506 [Dendrobium chrysotoxum]|uniref:E2 ubiquitin-conjugating enzyme n=1 Tax=Dendrobium chrysotoxum TaxID=161865 RepID=A0AAV7HBM1_DENCH|nr:hypothetical protein IEQ34_005506 [Dendrobium chrysotoxum]